MTEEFKEIKKYPDYLINRNGTVKDKRTKELVEVKTNILGRPSVDLNGKNHSLDMLLACTFNEEIKGEGFILRYKDNDISNVNVNNLYWDYVEEEEQINEIINEINKKKMENEKNKLMIEARDKTVYIISKEGEVIGEYNGCAELDKKYNKTKFFNSYKSSLKFSSLLGGFIVNKRDWNEEKKQEILNKVNRTNKMKPTTPNDFKKLDKSILLISDKGEIIKEYSSAKELDGVVFFGGTSARQKISKINYVMKLGGYLVYKRNWNEAYRQKIFEKERRRHRVKDIKPVDQPEISKELTVIKEDKPKLFDRIINWFRGLFKRK